MVPPAAAPRIAFYGDDFTGATDTLATAAQAGLRSRLFLRLPTPAQRARAGPLDCLGLAGAARAMTPSEMAAELAPVADFFRASGARLLHYKVCSTFDSAPGTGNIDAAVRALLPASGHAWAAIVGGQPNLGRYCLFGNLFASAGSGGEVHRIDRHPTMSRHPVTPMHEADLRRHLALQGLDATLVPWPTCAQGGDALRARVAQALAGRPRALLFDVGEERDLALIGAELDRHATEAPLLVVGSSSVMRAAAAHPAAGRPTHGGSGAPPVEIGPARGPVLVLAGSLSPITARQVAAARSYDKVQLDPQRLVEADGAALQACARELSARLSRGRHVLACTAVAQGMEGARAALPARAVAEATAALLAAVLAATPLGRVGIAGGDTSSHAVQALDAWGLSFHGALAPGVPLCRLHSDRASLDGLELMLKGGQMGEDDLFEILIAGQG